MFWGLDTVYCLAWCLKSVLNVKAVVGSFNQEKDLEGAFSVIVKSWRNLREPRLKLYTSPGHLIADLPGSQDHPEQCVGAGRPRDPPRLPLPHRGRAGGGPAQTRHRRLPRHGRHEVLSECIAGSCIHTIYYLHTIYTCYLCILTTQYLHTLYTIYTHNTCYLNVTTLSTHTIHVIYTY